MCANFALIGAGGFVAPRHLQAIRDTGSRQVEAASDVAALMAEELGVDERWQDAQVSVFKEIARGYVVG